MIMRLKKFHFLYMTTILLFLFLAFSKIVYAKNYKELTCKNLTIENGLKKSTVESIIQDHKGYIWIATGAGLQRYDGENFKTCKNNCDVESSKNLSSNYITTILEDKDNELWIGTSNGLNKLDNNRQNLIKYFPNDKNSISNYNVSDIIQDRSNNIWIATENGLNYYNKKNKTFKHFFYNENDKNSISDNCIATLFEDKEGIIWIGTRNGLNSFNPYTKKITRYLNKLSDEYITKIYGDSYHNIWIGTKLGGINKYNKKENKFKIYKTSNDKKALPSNYITTMYEDIQKNFWIGTENGLCKYNKKDNNFIIYKKRYGDIHSLVNNHILSITEDRSGMIWVGTNGGISFFNPNLEFNHYKKESNKINTISDYMISGIYLDKSSLLWVGTNNGGLNCINRNTGEIECFTNNNSDEHSISSNSVTSVIGDKDNNIWVGTNYGLNKYDKKAKKFINYLHNDSVNSLINNEIRCLLEDDTGEIWIGTKKGIDSFNKKTNRFTHYNFLLDKHKINDYYIFTIHQDKQDKDILWLGCSINGGIIKFNKKTKRLEQYKEYSKNGKIFSLKNIKCISEDENNNLWICTSNGLNKFNKNNQQFTTYTERNGICNNYVYGVLFDKENNPWISTNGGIAKLDIKSDTFINFDISDGLQSNEFNDGSYFKSSSGEMFFGGINGITSFYPENISKDNFRTKVVIENLNVQNKSIIPKHNIKLKYNENNISIEFFYPDYKNLSKIQYEYMLEGIDKEWIFGSHRGYCNYLNLPSGQYVFKVRARNGNGIWSEDEKINIVVSTPPWESLTAYSIYIVMFITVLYIIWKYIDILECKVQQRTLELNNKLIENDVLYKKNLEIEKFKNTYFVNLSHELRTPLNVILSAVQFLSKCGEENIIIDKKKFQDYMSIIRKNSNNLLKIINDLIDSSKMESGTYVINFVETDIIYLVEETALSMKSYVESKNIELIIDPEVEEKKIKCDPVEIERCIINLINNAIKFTPSGGSIWVSIYDKDDKIEISVKDTGIGISKEDQKFIFERFFQINNNIRDKKVGSGIGLALVKYVVELHNGTIRVKSEELNKGSEFIITLPSNQDNKF